MELDKAIKAFEEDMRDNLCKHQEFALCHDEDAAFYHARLAEEYAQVAEWLRELKAYKEQEPCEDVISREAALAMSEYIGESATLENPYAKPEEVVRVRDIMSLPPVILAQSWKPMNNRQWIDFLAKAWEIIRDIGRKRTGIVELYLLAFSLAKAQIEGREEE